MELDFKVRNVLLSPGAIALTLEQVQWMREGDEMEGHDDPEGPWPKMERVPAFSVELSDEGVDVWGSSILGGKLTELRVDGDQAETFPSLSPGDHISLTVRTA